MTLARSALSLSSARFAVKSLAFLASILVARHLGRFQYGEYSLTLAFILIFSFLADFGMVSLLIREVAFRPADQRRLLSHALVLQLWLSLAVSVTAVVVGFSIEPNPTIRAAVLVGAAGLCLESIGRPFSGALIGSSRIATAAIIIAGSSIVNTVAIVAVVALGGNVVQLVAVSIPVGLLTSLSLALVTRHSIGSVVPTHIFPRRDGLQLLREAVPFAVLAGSAILYTRIDVLMLGRMIGSAAVGTYSAADRVIDGLLVVPAAIGSSIYPRLAAKPTAAVPEVRAMLRWAFPLCLCLTSVACLAGKFLLPSVYGSRYGGVVPAFDLLAPLVVFSAVSIPLGYLFQAGNRTTVAISTTLLGLLVNMTSNLVLIPRWSVNGAALSASISEGAVLLALISLVFVAGQLRDDSETPIPAPLSSLN